MRTKSPLLIGGSLDAGLASVSPFEGLPGEFASRLYSLPDGESLAGLGGILAYFNHFLQWEGPAQSGAGTSTSGGGWTLSDVVATSNSTIAQSNVRNGEIAIAASAIANSSPTLQLGITTGPMPFIYAVGKQIWCFARLKIATVASTEFFFGLGTAKTQPTVTNTFPADGIFFDKAAAATNLALDVRTAGTSTQKTNVLTTALADATYVTIGFRVNKSGHIIPYQNGVALTSSVVAAGSANIPGSGNPMQFMLGFRGASQTVTLDWLALGQEI